MCCKKDLITLTCFVAGYIFLYQKLTTAYELFVAPTKLTLLYPLFS